MLFAPAHRGAALLDLAQSSLGGVDFLLATLGFAKHFSVLKDLEADGQFLSNLLKFHEQVAEHADAEPLLAKAIAVAAADRIVHQVDFLFGDATFEIVPNSNHTSVCKPNEIRHQPLDIVKRFL